MRICFASQARRRWLVVLVYAVIAGLDLAMCYGNGNETIGAAMIIASGILSIALWIVFTRVAGDMRARGDEREMYRRDHAHYLAYYVVGMSLMGAIFAGSFRGPSAMSSVIQLALRMFVAQLPKVLLWATFFLYLTLPQAILLWTEPDMEEELRG